MLSETSMMADKQTKQKVKGKVGEKDIKELEAPLSQLKLKDSGTPQPREGEGAPQGKRRILLTFRLKTQDDDPTTTTSGLNRRIREALVNDLEWMREPNLTNCYTKADNTDDYRNPALNLLRTECVNFSFHCSFAVLIPPFDVPQGARLRGLNYGEREGDSENVTICNCTRDT